MLVLLKSIQGYFQLMIVHPLQNKNTFIQAYTFVTKYHLLNAVFTRKTFTLIMVSAQIIFRSVCLTFFFLLGNSQEKHIFLEKTRTLPLFFHSVYKVNNILLLRQLTNESKSNSGQFAQDENQTQHACQENVTLLWTLEMWNSKSVI